MAKYFSMRNRFFFAPDGAGAAGASGEGSSAAGDAGVAGVTQQDAAADTRRAQSRRNPLSDVKYGRQPEEMQPDRQDAAAATVAADEKPEESFEDLIAGRHKAEFEAKVQGIIRQRLKNHHEDSEKLAKIQPLLEAVAKKYGVDSENLDALTAKVTDDDALYEEEAMNRRIPVETLKQMKQLERTNAQLLARREQDERERTLQAHYQKLVNQGNQCKAVYAGFDLQRELQNPTFARLTSPQVGIDVRTAYEVVHRNEIQPAMMQAAAQKSAEQVAASVRANGLRPAENGIAANDAAAGAKTNPKDWTAADREEVRRRVRRGEKIYL